LLGLEGGKIGLELVLEGGEAGEEGGGGVLREVVVD